MRIHLLSLRAYDSTGMAIDADIVEGVAIWPVIERMSADPAASYPRAQRKARPLVGPDRPVPVMRADTCAPLFMGASG
ncbi:hypothetical protein [Lichenicoccus roseus]|uniref:hypothetical protein n=1 Tax=Lichenicoccus roseus TaxID=2683649 RepID=UPI00197F3649